MPYLYQFDVHHIFPREMFSEQLVRGDFTSPTIGEALGSLFQGQNVSISLDMEANKIGLFSLPGTIANLSTLVGEGFGASDHGFHSAYNSFLIGQIRAVLTSSSLDGSDNSATVLDLHYFATELATGNIMDSNGEPVHVTGDLASIQSGWTEFQSGLADPTHVRVSQSESVWNFTLGIIRDEVV